jgi:hypothetical protein
MAASTEKRLTEDTMSPFLRGMEYAVRGQVVIAADKINDELASKKGSYPFDHIVYTNIGNPQSVGQKPLKWPRQVSALVDLPDEAGVNHPHVRKLFPADVIRRAKEIKVGLGGHGSGAYTHSQGARCFRKDIAKFIEERDGGVPSDPENIFMSNGASSSISNVMQALIADSSWYVPTTLRAYFLDFTFGVSDTIFSFPVSQWHNDPNPSISNLQCHNRPSRWKKGGLLSERRQPMGLQYG